MPIEATTAKNPIVAALLNFFLFGGVGYLYMGQKSKGIWAIIYVIIIWVILVCDWVLGFILSICIIGLLLWPVGIIIFVILIVVQALFAFDAFKVATKLQTEPIEECECGLGFLSMLPGFKAKAN